MKLDFQEKNLNLDRDLNHELSKFPHQPMFKCYLSFQEEHLSIGWGGNLDSSMIESARLEIGGSNPGPDSNFSLENLISKCMCNISIQS